MAKVRKKKALKPAPVNCCALRKGQKVSVNEYGKRLIVDFEVREAKSSVCRIDGCLKKNDTAPDFSIASAASDTIFVELKGKDVAHAIEQLIAGVKWWVGSKPIARRSGVVVCNEVPRIKTKIQLLTQKFAKECGGPVHVFSRDSVEAKFESLLRF